MRKARDEPFSAEELGDSDSGDFTPSIKEVSSKPVHIDVERDKFPFAIVWTPIPCITWFLPFVGHMVRSLLARTLKNIVCLFKVLAFHLCRWAWSTCSCPRTVSFLRCFSGGSLAPCKLLIVPLNRHCYVCRALLTPRAPYTISQGAFSFWFEQSLRPLVFVVRAAASVPHCFCWAWQTVLYWLR